MTKDEHLAHLLTLTSPPFVANYAMTRARELALTAGREDLPALFCRRNAEIEAVERKWGMQIYRQLKQP